MATTEARVATAEQAAPEARRIEAPPNGPAAAAILAACIGSAWLGLIIPLSEAIAPLKNALNWYNPVGPLSGKTTTTVLAYLIAWAALHAMWKGREVDFGRVWRWSLILRWRAKTIHRAGDRFECRRMRH
jgi:hypothetical protein